jgi:RNA polymerase-binding transcription factor DksA
MILSMAHGTSPNFGIISNSPPDLNEIDANLDAVEVALVRLENGTYFSDEITGKPLDEQLLTNNPIARRV